MIPADLVSRLRVLLDTPLPQVEGVSPVHPDTAQFAPGQRFTAKIISPLPDGTFKALVAGRTVTLSLPQSVKSGDVLELEVNHTTAQAVFARLTEPTAQGLPRPQISTAGQLISQLLTGQQGSPDPAPLNRGAPLLAQPPQKAADLAPALAQAVTESGMFYESHQAQWINGQLPLARLFREPQTQVTAGPQKGESPTANELKTGVPETPQPRTTDLAEPATAKTSANDAQATSQAALNNLAATGVHANSPGETSSNPLPQVVPQQLASLVQNQLESLATQVLAWQGQVWPGQTMQWTIENAGHDGARRGDADPADTWQTTLRLQLPRLGNVEAQLHLTPAGVALKINTQDPTAAEQLRASLPALSDALAAAGVPLTGSAVIENEPA